MIHEGPLVWKVNRDKTIGKSDLFVRFWGEWKKGKNRKIPFCQTEKKNPFTICSTVVSSATLIYLDNYRKSASVILLYLKY